MIPPDADKIYEQEFGPETKIELYHKDHPSPTWIRLGQVNDRDGKWDYQDYALDHFLNFVAEVVKFMVMKSLEEQG